MQPRNPGGDVFFTVTTAAYFTNRVSVYFIYGLFICIGSIADCAHFVEQLKGCKQISYQLYVYYNKCLHTQNSYILAATMIIDVESLGSYIQKSYMPVATPLISGYYIFVQKTQL